MAGIGFELRKLLRKESYSGLIQAYAYAGIISSGPWVLSIVGILAIGLLSSTTAGTSLLVGQFQVSVTYLMASSLVLTGIIQLGFTRFIADDVVRHPLVGRIVSAYEAHSARIAESGNADVIDTMLGRPGHSFARR